MIYKNYKLGDLVELYDETNQNGEFSNLDNLQGINNEKYFQGCKSNKNDIDLFRYRICRNGMFAYNRATSRNGEKISIAYRQGPDCLISPSYYCFKIINDKLLLPDYLLMWFKRPVFDRYARFNSWGSATEFFTFEDFCDTDIKIPSLDKQKKMVYYYKTISERINILEKINKNLEDQAFYTFEQMTKDCEKNISLCDIAKIIMGTSPEGETLNTDSEGMIFYQGKTDFGFRFPQIRVYTTNPLKKAKAKDILMSVRAPVGSINIATEDCAIGRGIAAIRPLDNNYSYLFYVMKELDKELNMFNDDGTVFGSINKDDLYSLKTPNISADLKNKFNNWASKIDDYILSNELEIKKLNKMIDIIMYMMTI